MTPKLKMVQIYGGKDPDWQGWHNFVLELGDDSKALAGPLDPETSKQVIEAIAAERKRVK